MNSHDAVFLDTSGWIASLDTDDRWHARAVEEYGRLGASGRPFVTTDWVIAETGNGLARVKVRRRFPDAVKRFFASPNCRLIRVDEKLFHEALELYRRSDDKSWGLVDCASFIVMRQECILDAFTTDQHYQQAGFRPLLAAKPR
ncbi:MAG: PIN domain-containing protein [Planctomycetes bacterium]|nr:PIN domain-containing protein [Planctomycetota bacterium]MBU4397762.1 PIN domain-containing protein [Planctomycetota bacterium]MCG2683822.1 PIN domain-containing protein [Planctomycetales bacterium]